MQLVHVLLGILAELAQVFGAVYTSVLVPVLHSRIHARLEGQELRGKRDYINFGKGSSQVNAPTPYELRTYLLVVSERCF